MQASSGLPLLGTYSVARRAGGEARSRAPSMVSLLILPLVSSVILDTAGVLDFCRQLRIPSKDEGIVALNLWGTQQYILAEVARGLECGIHDFCLLKGGRQIGGSTVVDALAIYW